MLQGKIPILQFLCFLETMKEDSRHLILKFTTTTTTSSSSSDAVSFNVTACDVETGVCRNKFARQVFQTDLKR